MVTIAPSWPSRGVPGFEDERLDSGGKAADLNGRFALPCYGVPITKDVERLRRFLDPAVSDPFIPDEIRSAVVDLLENRIQVLQGLYVDEFEKYSNNLAKGKHGPMTELDDVNRIHNRIVEQQRLRGCGIAQIEEEVHEIRALIHDYFDSFNPHRRWWRGKRARAGRRRKPAIDS